MSPFSREVIVALVGGTSVLAALAIFDVRGEQVGSRELAWIASCLAMSVVGAVATVGLLRRARWAPMGVAAWSGMAVLLTIVAQLLSRNPLPWLVVVIFVGVMVLLSMKIVRSLSG